MTLIKGIALSFLSFLLFLSLTIFGFAFMVNSTLLNPNFLTAELDKIDFSALAQDIISEQMATGEDFPEELLTALNDAIPGLEQVIKEQVNATIDDAYNYLLGKREQPDLKTTLGDTFMTAEFVNSVLAELDLSLLLEQVLSGQTGEGEFPEEFTTALIDTFSELETELKQRVANFLDPIFKYLLGKTNTINLAQTLRDTILTPDFVTTLIDKLALSTMVSEFLGGALDIQLPEELQFLSDQMENAIAALELGPMIQAELQDAVDPLLDYLLGQETTIDKTISLASLVANLENSLKQYLLDSPPTEIEPYIRTMIIERIKEVIPAELTDLVEQALPDQWLQEQINAASVPVLEYLVGKNPSFSISVPLQTQVQSLKDAMWQEFQDSPPLEAAGLPPALLEEYFDNYFQGLADLIPATTIIDETFLPAELPAMIDQYFQQLANMIPATLNLGDVLTGILPAGQIGGALQSAEESLATARQNLDVELTKFETQLEDIQGYVSQFQTYYYILIAAIVLTVVGIALINRQVKAASRQLGIIFLLYGIIEYAGIIIGKSFAGTAISEEMTGGDIPQTLQDLPMQIVNDFTSPLQTFSLIVLIVGMLLVVVSFVYPRFRQSSTEDELPT